MSAGAYILCELLHRKPYSVVLVDEIETALTKLCNVLLQALDVRVFPTIKEMR